MFVKHNNHHHYSLVTLFISKSITAHELFKKKVFCVIINKHSVLPMLASYMYYVFICSDCNLEERYYDVTTCTISLLSRHFWYKLSAHENYPSELTISVNFHFIDFYCVVANFWLLKFERKLWVFCQISSGSFYR